VRDNAVLGAGLEGIGVGRILDIDIMIFWAMADDDTTYEQSRLYKATYHIPEQAPELIRNTRH
jgi:hypothetical protein